MPPAPPSEEEEELGVEVPEESQSRVARHRKRNPARQFVKELAEDGVLRKEAPFGHKVQGVSWEFRHQEGRRARQGAGMMGPDCTHWHGMDEVWKHSSLKFLAAVGKAAATKGPEL